MADILNVLYNWLTAAHIIFVIFWMAGLFMLPRFLVYHQEAVPGSPEAQQWVIREKRLVTIIMNPSMVSVWILGLMLMVNLGAYAEWWFRIKLLLIILLSAYHMWMGHYSQELALERRKLSGRQLRLLNEVPGITAILVIILVVVKPF